MGKRLHYGTTVTFLSQLRIKRGRLWTSNIRSLYNSARRCKVKIRAERNGRGFIVWRRK